MLDRLLELVEVPVPEKLLEDEVNTRKHNLEHHQLGQMGLDLEKYLELQGKTVEEFEAETREAAVKGIKTEFVLDELVKQEKLNVSQEELTEHLMRRAASSGMSPDQFAQAVVEQGQVPLLVGARSPRQGPGRRGREGHGQGHQRRGRRPGGREEEGDGVPRRPPPSPAEAGDDKAEEKSEEKTEG